MRKSGKIFLFTFAAALTCAGRFRKTGAGSYVEHTISVAGRERSYTIYEPSGPAPETLLVLLHGGGGKARGMMRLAPDMPELADRHRVLLIYPEGIDGHWNDGRAGISKAAKQNADDIAFMREIITAAGHRQKIRRVFAAGISNGGMMAQRIACELPEIFLGVVSVAAQLTAELRPNCKPAAPIAVMFINGEKDPIVPYHGGKVKVLFSERGEVISTDESFQFWFTTNRCAEPVESSLATGVRLKVAACGKKSVRLITVADGGHAWPGGVQYMPEMVIGKTSRDFSASEKIFEFIAEK